MQESAEGRCKATRCGEVSGKAGRTRNLAGERPVLMGPAIPEQSFQVNCLVSHVWTCAQAVIQLILKKNLKVMEEVGRVSQGDYRCHEICARTATHSASTADVCAQNCA